MSYGPKYLLCIQPECDMIFKILSRNILKSDKNMTGFLRGRTAFHKHNPVVDDLFC